ncbi:somatostatin-like [Stegostoma tigrinum]|uniref:somatostatin-like n=1 Tax=Stegostoma tigrinum TaxID=3053191 RepID=UPI0028704EEE|nr:somatostatin-like [Stegostoma tigrinum]
MWCSRAQCALALLSIALAMLSAGAASTADRYRELLQTSVAAAEPRSKAELSKNNLIHLISELGHDENETLDGQDLPEKRSNVQNPPVAPRSTDTDCVNFAKC